MAELHEDKGDNGKVSLLHRFMHLLGMEMGRGSHLIVLTRRFPFFLLGLGVLGLLAMGAFTYYTSTPGFCNSCHIMEPFYASWQQSVHHNVPCEKCHYGTGISGFVKAKLGGLSEVIKTVTRTASTMPHAQIPDAACLRPGCHETRLLKGKVLFKGKYHFDHTPHLTTLRRGMTLHCTTCHSQIVQGNHIEVTESVCFDCHFGGNVHKRYLSPIAGCTKCHSMPTQSFQITPDLTFQHNDFVSKGVECWKCHFDSVQGTGGVPKQVCQTCHRRPEDLEKYSDEALMHQKHVDEHKIECYECHTNILHGLNPKPHPQKTSCDSCHSDHSLQEDVFKGIGPDGQAVTPSVHSQAQVDCIACHEFPTEDHGKPAAPMVTYQAAAKACVQCHGPGAKDLLDSWEQAFQSMQQQAETQLTAARSVVEAMPQTAPARKDAEAALDKARHDLDYIEKGVGVHNPEYAFDLLDQISATIRKAAGSAAPPKASPKPAAPAPAKTSSAGSGG